MTLPKAWKTLTEQEQAEWIQTYFMPKTRTPEPYPRIDSIAKGQKIKTQKGLIINIPKETEVTQRNPDIVREYEAWVGKWLITVFHDKKFPVTKFLSFANPSLNKWIAQELSFENWGRLQAILLSIGRKYRIVRRKNEKSTRKIPNFTLSLRDTTTGEKP
ncbi:hypothetical protein MUO83_09910 [Candidatus Bathyarchaeota archaeon]|nr:hypothetical protein [Candidatus Bathyarchaeota archaeon]